MLKKNLVFILVFSFSQLHAQFNLQDSTVNGFMFFTNYSYNLPAGDLAERFGNNSMIGGSILYKFGKNWLLGVDGNFIFGGKIKEDSLFKGLKNSNGDIMGEDGFPAEINLFERGFSFNGKIGKIFSMFGSNANSGLFITATGGILQHKIRMEIKTGNVPQLKDDYKKGYDRLTNGFATSQYIGWIHLDKNKMTNFHLGIEITEAFTKSRRDWDFDTMKKDDKQRLDLFIGFKIGWILPIYNKRKGDLTYYN